MLVYTGLRLLLFAVPFAVLMVAGVDFVWSVLIAAFGSAIASIFLLARYRDELSESISTRSERMRARKSRARAVRRRVGRRAASRRRFVS